MSVEQAGHGQYGQRPGATGENVFREEDLDSGNSRNLETSVGVVHQGRQRKTKTLPHGMEVNTDVKYPPVMAKGGS